MGALAFSPDGRFLVAVALDNVHSVMVFDWRCGTVISQGRGFAGEPPQARFILVLRLSFSCMFQFDIQLQFSSGEVIWSYRLHGTGNTSWAV